MPKKASLILYLLLAAGITGALLTSVASKYVGCRQDTATQPGFTSAKSALPTARSTLCSFSATVTPKAAPSTTPTPAPTVTSTPTATPPSTPISVSPPLVSTTGALAYVEGGRLFVVKVADGSVVVIAAGVTHGAPDLAWSPGGRWLLYATETGGAGTDSATQREGIHIWDSQLGQTHDLARVVSALPADVSGIQGAIWSPEGTRVLFPCPPEKASCRAWVLDLTTTTAWLLSKPSISYATWIDEDKILCRRGKEDTPLLLSVTTPTQAFTETVPVRGTFALSFHRDYVAYFEEGGDKGQKLSIVPLSGHPTLSPSDQPTVTASGRAPLWSPDGRWVAYGAETVTGYAGKGPYTILADARGIGETRSVAGLLPVAWSPDGRLLAAFSCSDTDCRLSVIDAASGQATSIASGKDLHLWDLAWSPRGVYLTYSLSGPDLDRQGLTVWNRAIGEQDLLIQAGETQPLTDLQWAAHGCTLYAAQRESREKLGLAVSGIWGIGPAWQDRWRVAPGLSEDPRAITEGVRPGGGSQRGHICPGPLLDDRRLIAYYGTPSGPGLGILGRYGIAETLGLLNQQAQVYRDLDPRVETIPVLHMVTTIADSYPGIDQDYNHRVPHEIIRPWIASIEAEGGWSILDVQLGRANLVDEIDAIEPLLLEPDVHLAVDPEFVVGEHEVPGEDLGKITGSQINWIQARMDQVARAVGQRKLLVIHQFNDRMIEQKEMILDYPLVELVWDADGFGSPWSKIADYDQYRAEAGFEYGGFKIFYRFDKPLMLPGQVLSLYPPPHLVIYQ